MIIPYLRAICVESQASSKELQEFANKPVLTFLRWDLKRQASFLLHQAIVLRFAEDISNRSLPSILDDYKQFIISAKKRFEITYSIKAEDADKSTFDIVTRLLAFLLRFNSGSNLISNNDIEFCMTKLDPQGTFYKAPESFAVTYFKHLKIIGDKMTIGPQTFTDSDRVMSTKCSIPIITIDGALIKTRYISMVKYEFDPKIISDNIKLVGSGLDYIMCCDWSNKKFMHLLGYLGSLVWDFNPRHFKSNIPIMTYYHIHRVLFNLKTNVQTVDTTGYSRSHWFSEVFSNFLKTIRSKYGVVFDAPQMLGRILSGDQPSEHNNLADYLIRGIGNPNSVSAESYNAFLASPFNFEELDIRKGAISMEADDDTGDISPDDPSDDGTEPPPDDAGDDDTGDDTDTDPGDDPSGDDPGDDTGDDAGDDGTDDSDNSDDSDTLEPNIDTSDKSGIAFELSEEETLDSVIYRREVATYITHLLSEKRLANEQLEILKKLKMYWLNLLSVKTIQDILKGVKKIK